MTLNLRQIINPLQKIIQKQIYQPLTNNYPKKIQQLQSMTHQKIQSYPFILSLTFINIQPKPVHIMKIITRSFSNVNLCMISRSIHSCQNTPVSNTPKSPLKIANKISFSYVKVKDINAIRDQYQSQGTFKVFQKASGFYLSQVWKDFKADYSLFKSIKSIPCHLRTTQQKHLYHKIMIDMIKFGPAFAIFNVPFGLPIFYIYLKLFPQLIPSWMMVDSINDYIQKSREERRVNAWKYFNENYGQNVLMPYLKQAIFKENQSLEDMRRIACICYKDYTDGTEYLSEKLGVTFKSGLVMPNVSLGLLKFNLKNNIKHDYKNEEEFSKLGSFEERLYLKLQKEIEKLKASIIQ